MQSSSEPRRNGSNTGKPFRILIVDDSAADRSLLKELMKGLSRPHQEFTVSDGLEALDFLHCRGTYKDTPRPNLILLDMNMPRLSGLEVLAAIKGDPNLCVIPVIMLSTSSAPEDVHRCYQSHANVYVQKPRDLDEAGQLIQAIEAFWMQFALLPPCHDYNNSRDLNNELPSLPVV
jgi:CheY-like chemotaxis protein